jgi:EAL domain-containing protein (putative c-di-GMP-specific phosphodiesterase class I)
MFPPGTVPAEPYLEHYPEQGGAANRIHLSPLPFRIGRSKTAHWVVSSPRVSKMHAEIVQVGEDYYVRDLRSTNGTFVNGRQVEECRLADGDLLHVAQTEFRFGWGHSVARGLSTDPIHDATAASIIRGRKHLRNLLSRDCARPAFEPIVDLATGATWGYEAVVGGSPLGPGLSRDELFCLAERYGLTAEVSQAFRRAAVDQAGHLPEDTLLFLDTHPCETSRPGLGDEVARLQGLLGEHRRVVLEVPEQLVTDLSVLRAFRDQARERNVQLAFDDFGAGQDRLVALAEASPDFIKLDRGLVGGIAQAAGRLEVVRSLCQVSRDLGVGVIALGIETAEEAQVCRDLGCRFGQGFFFGHPQPHTVGGGN